VEVVYFEMVEQAEVPQDMLMEILVVAMEVGVVEKVIMVQLVVLEVMVWFL